MATTPVKKTPHKHEKLARIYDDEILPLFAQRFGQMALRGFSLPPRAAVLEVGCATGYVTIELLRRLDGDSRIIAIDPSPPLLDVARSKAGAEHAGKKIFFRSQPIFPKLGFAEDVYDAVVANLVLGDAPDPAAAVKDLARVTKPGGELVVTVPLHGTWAEFLDVYREVLHKHEKLAALRRLEQYAASLPEADTAAKWLEGAGLSDVQVEVEHWELLFKSAREFFYAPLIEHGPLPAWKEIAGKGDEMQDVFFFIKEAIDTYFGSGAFPVGIVAGRVSGRKPTADAPRAGLAPDLRPGIVARIKEFPEAPDAKASAGGLGPPERGGARGGSAAYGEAAGTALSVDPRPGAGGLPPARPSGSEPPPRPDDSWREHTDLDPTRLKR